MTPNSRVVNPFLKSALEVRYTLSTTPKPHLLAEVVPPLPTDAALATRYSHL